MHFDSGHLAAVEREVLRKVPHLLESGGFLPCLENSVPPDIPLANLTHFVEVVRSCWQPGE